MSLMILTLASPAAPGRGQHSSDLLSGLDGILALDEPGAATLYMVRLGLSLVLVGPRNLDHQGGARCSLPLHPGRNELGPGSLIKGRVTRR